MFSKRKKILKKLDEIWGKEVDKFRNFDFISIFHIHKSKEAGSEIIDKKTWSDLSFGIYHFSEQVTNNSFSFDYKIHVGPVASGNAIKLLEIMGYPDSIIEEAHALSKKLLKGNGLSNLA